jgi:hypothetical protein
VTEPERAEEFREAVAKIPSRSFKPTKRQGAVGLGTILAVTIALLRFEVYQSRSHHVDDTAYLECIAQAQSQATVPGIDGLGFPTADPSFGLPGTVSQQQDPGQVLGDAAVACSKYPH